jgi:hypothetical protein
VLHQRKTQARQRRQQMDSEEKDQAGDEHQHLGDSPPPATELAPANILYQRFGCGVSRQDRAQRATKLQAIVIPSRFHRRKDHVSLFVPKLRRRVCRRAGDGHSG